MFSKVQLTIAILTLSLLVFWAQFDRIFTYSVSGYLERALGAEITIKGPIRISPGEVTNLTFKQIAATTPDSTITAGQLELGFNTRSLFFGPLLVTRLKINKGHLALQTAEERRALKLDTQMILTYLDARLADFEKALIEIDNIEVNESRLTYVDSDQDIDLNLNSASLIRSRIGKLVLSIDGQLNQTKLTVRAQLDRKAPLILVRAEGHWGENELSIDGHIQSITPLNNLDIVMDAKGPSARPFLDVLGAKEVRDGHFAAVAHLHDHEGRLVWFSHLSIGDLVLHGQVTHSLEDEDFEIAFTGAGPSLKEAGALIDYLHYSELPFVASGVLTKQGTGLTLESGKINLGDGYFEANGTLPRFPSWDDGNLKVLAKKFDITILQPFSPCAIPNLPMDWTGDFSSDSTGAEVFQIDFSDAIHHININGALGQYPEFLDSVINVKTKGMDLNTLTACIGLPLTETTPFNSSFYLKKKSSGWQINDLQIESSLLQAQSSLQVSNEATVKSHVLISTQNLKNLTTVFDIPSGLTVAPATFEFDLSFQDQLLTFKNGTATSKTAKGTFFGHLTTGDGDSSAGLTVDVAGTDIQSLFEDAPKLAAAKNFAAKAKILIDAGGKITLVSDLSLADNRLRVKGTFPQSTSLAGLSIAVEGQGSNLEQFFGAGIPHPLPAVPFDIALALTHRGHSLAIEKLLLETGDQKLSGNLILGLADNLSLTDGQLLLEGNSSQTLLKLIGLNPDFQSEPYKLSLNIEGDAKSINMRVDTSTIGLTDLSGLVSIKPGKLDQHTNVKIHDINIDLISKRLHLPTFIPSLVTATDDKKDPVLAKTRVIPHFDLPWDLLSDIKLTFSHEARRVDLQPGNHASTKLAFAIENGRLHSQNISWRSDKSDGTAVLVIDQRNDDRNNARVRFEITSERIPLLWLFTGTPIDVTGEHLQFNARVDTLGRDSTELMENLNGLVAFRGGGGIINSNKLDTLFGDFLSQLSNRVFGTADKQTNVLCSGAAFTITNGKLLFDPALAVRTSRFDILATGEINLANEKLKLQLNSRSRQGIGVSAVSSLVPRVGIVGTLAKPQVQLSRTETALSGGAAIASFGLTILASGLWDRLKSSTENPCDAIYNKALNDPNSQFGQLVHGERIQNKPAQSKLLKAKAPKQ